MRQKVAICCGYLHEPAVIMLDEPLTGLDPRGIRTMQESIRRRAAAGAAVMISSHLLSLVEDLCTSILLMAGGGSSSRATWPICGRRWRPGAGRSRSKTSSSA